MDAEAPPHFQRKTARGGTSRESDISMTSQDGEGHDHGDGYNDQNGGESAFQGEFNTGPTNARHLGVDGIGSRWLLNVCQQGRRNTKCNEYHNNIDKINKLSAQNK